ncbi:type II CAAX prenyl endopeptidase Rce1 family protein [Solitalea lacus]|uniref:CPBP family glutamic-type intramembrane protease n=1 Tax=Solitalea lacus TaxID=2911172 RepID=UPI001EDA51A0|nr:CPBP family glutamic-type intramembrane protease [Solitalea lacus]UKJ09300.1 CPBP family glutamic-type intramembrane protease [Solitalea lacus]
MKNWISIIAGFIFLFFIYHFPEFFQSFWVTAVFKIGFLVAAIFLCRLQGWKLLEGYGLSLTGKWYRILLVGLLVGLASFTLSILLSIGLNYENLESLQTFGFFLKSLPLTLFMTFFPSIAEDILTRGYLYGHLKSLKPIVWILLSSALYVLNHIWRLNEDISVLSYLFLLGLVLGFCVVIKKSLWLALGIHWGANIAYELSNEGLHLNSTGDKNASTWMLSLVWGTILVILIMIHRNRTSQSIRQIVLE